MKTLEEHYQSMIDELRDLFSKMKSEAAESNSVFSKEDQESLEFANLGYIIGVYRRMGAEFAKEALDACIRKLVAERQNIED